MSLQDGKVDFSKTLIVNIAGGPGAGKSTTAAGVFHKLKKAGINCEYVQEWCKGKVWERNAKVFQAQPYIFGKQFWTLMRCIEEVDVIVTDSPLFLCAVYNEMYGGVMSFTPYALDNYSQFRNLNFVLERTKEYESAGRNQTKEEAKEVDKTVRKMLDLHHIPYRILDYETADQDIVEDVIRVLSPRN
jgi:nicotinamide riboside kinase